MAQPDVVVGNASHMSGEETLWDFFESLPARRDLRAELIEGTVFVTPTANWLHADIIEELRHMLEAVLNRDEFKAVEGITIDLPATGDAIVPDLVVAPRERLRSLEWHQSCEGVELIVEVVSPHQGHRDHDVKLKACARSGVPVYMVVDPYQEDGTVTVCIEPQPAGTYAEVTTYAFGKIFKLPDPISADVDTSRFGPIPSRKKKPDSAS